MNKLVRVLASDLVSPPRVLGLRICRIGYTLDSGSWAGSPWLGYVAR